MSKALMAKSSEAQQAVSRLFDKAPLLIEVRFPNMGTSSDWHLCEDEEQLEQIVERLGSGVELHLSSVWDLKNVQGENVQGEVLLRT